MNSSPEINGIHWKEGIFEEEFELLNRICHIWKNWLNKTNEFKTYVRKWAFPFVLY